jgi:FkbM family methyltransferase
MRKSSAIGDLSLLVLGLLIGLPTPSLIRNVVLYTSGSTGTGASSFFSTTAVSSTGSPPSSSTLASARKDVAKRERKIQRSYNLDPEKHHFCNNTEPMGKPGQPLPDWDIIGTPTASSWPAIKCHWTKMWHSNVPMKPLDVCTHDPAQDGVISTFLHTYNFWGGPDDYNFLLAMGPCTPERPYMLDIGANLGVYTILGASRGCKSLSFEPLSQNILRLYESLKIGGFEKNVKLFKHAVGKYFTDVKIGFRAFNPGASALGVDAGEGNTEHMKQITIDGLLLGNKAPVFEDEKLPLIGKHINFVKIDTEGYDVAVVDGMLRTLLEGRPPHILIEFTPGDAQGTAGCNPYHFVELMYAAGYRMYEGAKASSLRSLLDIEIPFLLSGKGKRVFEAWFIHDNAAKHWMALGLMQRPSN